MMTPAVDDLIETLQLAPHPEGGFFRETYRAAAGNDGRSASTAIYFLLPRGHRSRLHRLSSDEVWHFYGGGPLVVVEIDPQGRVHETRIGPGLTRGETLQHVVPAGNWFGAYPASGSAYCLVGCTVAPGFEFGDFEMAERDELARVFPHADGLIRMLT